MSPEVAAAAELEATKKLVIAAHALNFRNTFPALTDATTAKKAFDRVEEALLDCMRTAIFELATGSDGMPDLALVRQWVAQLIASEPDPIREFLDHWSNEPNPIRQIREAYA